MSLFSMSLLIYKCRYIWIKLAASIVEFIMFKMDRHFAIQLHLSYRNRQKPLPGSCIFIILEILHQSPLNKDLTRNFSKFVI